MQGVFPPFLQRDFDEQALDLDGSTIAALDRDGTILWTNRAWIEAANDDFSLRSGGVQTAYLSSSAPEVARFFSAAFAAALQSGDPFEHEYACSSGSSFRLRALPVRGAGLLIAHSLVAEPPREPGHAPLETRYRTEDGIVVQCAHCRRVRRRDDATWDWVPQWTHALPAQTGHAICPACVGFYFRRRKKPR